MSRQDLLREAVRDAWTCTDSLQMNQTHSKDGGYFQQNSPTLAFSFTAIIWFRDKNGCTKEKRVVNY